MQEEKAKTFQDFNVKFQNIVLQYGDPANETMKMTSLQDYEYDVVTFLFEVCDPINKDRQQNFNKNCACVVLNEIWNQMEVLKSKNKIE
jgi:hypothetical protein